MSEPKWNLGRVQIIFTKSAPQLKLPLTVLIVFSMAALLALGWAEYDMRNQTEALRAEAAVIEYKNEVLKQNADSLNTLKGIERAAQEELGMVAPGTVLIEAQVK